MKGKINGLAAVVVVFFGLAAAEVARAMPEDPLEKAWESYEEYTRLHLEKALDLASEVLADPAAETDAQVTAQKTCVLVHLSQRDRRQARGALESMLATDPGARFSPEWDYPAQVIQFFHEVRDSLGEGTPDRFTIAVGDFENNSIWQPSSGRFDFDHFRLGLVHTIITDLATATGLRVVDRQRTAAIIEETKLVAAGVVDPSRAPAAGRLLGARFFLFGQFMILSANEVRIDMRVVHTESGEVLVARQITGRHGGKPQNFLDLEQRLVREVAAAVDSSLAAQKDVEPGVLRARATRYFENRAAGIAARKNYAPSKMLIGEALAREDRRDYVGALSVWKEVLKQDPENSDAKRRLLILGGKTS